MLQEAYRGDGSFLDGTALLAHPREIVYTRDTAGNVTTTVQGYRDKYKRRKALARYEDFARTIIDTYIAHLFAKSVTRDAEQLEGLEDWWMNVDGAGTHIADWMQQEQALAMVYGHVVVLMDRAKGPVEQPRTRAEQGEPGLRVYTPLDVLDWIWDNGRYQALKIVEAQPRKTLDENAPLSAETRGGGDGAPADLTYVEWTPEMWRRYNSDGVLLDEGEHGFGRVPAGDPRQDRGE